MELLGSFDSTLTNVYYQQLVSLLEAAIRAGDYGSGQAFDQTALKKLQLEAQAFATLPQPSAGQLVTDESFNYPLGLLGAQFAALLAESGAFDARLQQLLSVLDKDTALIDKLLAQAALLKWASTCPALGSTQMLWDFSAGYGPVADTALAGLWPQPVSSRPSLLAELVPSLGAQHAGLAPAASTVEFPVTSLVWKYAADSAQAEVLDQANWTKLSLLEPKALINYAPQPSVIPASSPFVVGGVSSLGSLPVYVQTSFAGRRRHLTGQAVNGVPFPLSLYMVDSDEIHIFVDYGQTCQRLLSSTIDYSVDIYGAITPLTLAAETAVDIFFEEEFPAYQCSVDRVNWSPLRMLDPDRPYPDDAASFTPVAALKDSQGVAVMPITDELGMPTGLTLRIGDIAPSDGVLLEVMSTASAATVGATAVLEVDFGRFGYMNSLRVSPFTTFPMLLKAVELQGLTADTRQLVWSGSSVIDQPVSIRLDKTPGVAPLVAKVFLTFYQPGYTLKQQTVNPPDALRRNVMSQLQAILPFNARNLPASLPLQYAGAQYEFGVADVMGQCRTAEAGSFVSGPWLFEGCPELIRFDTETSAAVADPPINTVSGLTPAHPVDFCLCYRAFDQGGAVVDQNLTGVPILDSQCMVFPFADGVNRTPIARAEIYLKIVHRTLTSVVQRILLQLS